MTRPVAHLRPVDDADRSPGGDHIVTGDEGPDHSLKRLRLDDGVGVHRAHQASAGHVEAGVA